MEIPIVSLEAVKQARNRLHGIAVRTPLLAWPEQDAERRLWLKPENLQPIGSFKLRGAYNKIASLSEQERGRGVIAYSSGNHAQGVAYAARALNVHAVIVMPRTSPKIKIDSTRALGAEIVLVGPGSAERQSHAEELAEKRGYVIVPPFNDEKIIAGQGTIGLEILEDLPEVDAIFAPIGGGGLISGIAAAIKLAGSRAKVIGVEPELAADAQASFRAGHVIEFPAEQTARTIADGLRTQSVGEIPFAHIRQYVDEIVTVNEDEIRAAMRRIAFETRLVAEPSGAVAAAGFFAHTPEGARGRRCVVIISGGNVEPAMLAEILGARQRAKVQ